VGIIVWSNDVECRSSLDVSEIVSRGLVRATVLFQEKEAGYDQVLDFLATGIDDELRFRPDVWKVFALRVEATLGRKEFGNWAWRVWFTGIELQYP